MSAVHAHLALLAALAGLAALPGPARAAIYTWTDGSGNVNVSNLAPPDDARGVRVAPDLPPGNPRAGGGGTMQVDALAERVRQLEAELVAAARPSAPASSIVVNVPPPVVQTVVVQAPPAAEPAMPYDPAAACAPGWGGCLSWSSWGAPFYAPVVFVQGPSASRHPLPRHPARPVAPVAHPGGAPWAMIRPLMP